MSENTNSPARWSKNSPSWGSPLRVQRNAYAFRVTMALTGGRMVCPSCDAALDLDTAEVDRPVPVLDYREGNCVYLCRGCNQTRSGLQSAGRDWKNADAYAALVREVSAGVTVPTTREARDWWENRPTSGPTVSRWA